MLEAAASQERQAAFKMQGALMFSVSAGLLASVAFPLLLRRRVAAAAASAERICTSRQEAALAEARRRAAVELKNAQNFSIEAFARDMLPVADCLEYALRHARTAGEDAPSAAAQHAEALVEGVALTERSLLEAFRKHAIERQEPLGQAFDPHAHEAVQEVPHAADIEPGRIAEVRRSGFTLHERVLRAAQVCVVARPSSPPAAGPAGTASPSKSGEVAGPAAA